MIHFNSVESSNIAAIGYEADTETLYVRFKGGHAWAYADVPPAKYTAFMEFPSKGSFLRKHILPFHKGEKYVEDVPYDEDVDDHGIPIGKRKKYVRQIGIDVARKGTDRTYIRQYCTQCDVYFETGTVHICNLKEAGFSIDAKELPAGVLTTYSAKLTPPAESFVRIEHVPQCERDKMVIGYCQHDTVTGKRVEPEINRRSIRVGSIDL